MNKRSNLPYLSGVWAWVESLIHSSGLMILIGLALLVSAINGLVYPLGQHPAEGLMVRLPLAIAPFTLLAATYWATGFARLTLGLTAVGIWAILLGSWSTESTGLLRVGGQVAESYGRFVSDRDIQVHLGAQVAADINDERVSLTFGMPNAQQKKLTFQRRMPQAKAHDGRIYALDRVVFDDDAHVAVLSIRSRANPGQEVIKRVAVDRPILVTNSTSAVDDTAGNSSDVKGDLRLKVSQMRNDFLKRLGAAVQLDLQWNGGSENAWYFADAPDLDKRHGTSPWQIQLLRIEGAQMAEFSVRRPSRDMVAWFGWSLIFLAMALHLFGSIREGRA
ncbi:MAG: hypothetical protein VYA30_06485 [Myxococcota bacterium]|nr:hypothetical protein [Myxococcota bacterium]